MSITSSEFLFRALVVLVVFLCVKFLHVGFRIWVWKRILYRNFSVWCGSFFFLSLVPCLFAPNLSSWEFCIRLHQALSGPISKSRGYNGHVELLLQKLLEGGTVHPHSQAVALPPWYQLPFSPALLLNGEPGPSWCPASFPTGWVICIVLVP